MIAQGIKSPHRSVRNAALYAIGQFSEYLMPEIGEYAGEVLPVLFHFVDAAMAELNAKVGIHTLDVTEAIRCVNSVSCM